MKPCSTSEQSELISAMSALNTEDTRKPFDGRFLTDEITDIAMAATYLSYAFNVILNQEPRYDAQYIKYCNEAIALLSMTDSSGSRHRDTHQLVEHSIEHIEAAMKINKKREEVA